MRLRARHQSGESDIQNGRWGQTLMVSGEFCAVRVEVKSSAEEFLLL